MVGTIDRMMTAIHCFTPNGAMPKIPAAGGIITISANDTIMPAALRTIFGLSAKVRLNMDCLLRTVNTCRIDVHPTIRKDIVCPAVWEGGRISDICTTHPK